MGCISSKEIGSEAQRKQNQRIEKALRSDRKVMEFQIKLLLLGAGESGKSTFAKQMKILFLEGYSKQELCFYKDIIHSNVILGLRTIVQEAQKRGKKFPSEVEVNRYDAIILYFRRFF